jgi:hypothetical protein
VTPANTPLLSIRINHSDCDALRAGLHFDTIRDFDAALRAVHLARRATETADATGCRVHFVLTWKDGASFHGSCSVDRGGKGLFADVLDACRTVLEDPRLHALFAGMKLTVHRMVDAALAEHQRFAGAHAANASEATWQQL